MYGKLREEAKKIVKGQEWADRVSSLTDEEIESALEVARRQGIPSHLDSCMLVGVMLAKGMAERSIDFDLALLRSQPGVYVGYPGKARCWAYKEDDTGICGRPAVGIDHVKGIAVCELHMPTGKQTQNSHRTATKRD